MTTQEMALFLEETIQEAMSILHVIENDLPDKNEIPIGAGGKFKSCSDSLTTALRASKGIQEWLDSREKAE